MRPWCFSRGSDWLVANWREIRVCACTILYLSLIGIWTERGAEMTVSVSR